MSWTTSTFGYPRRPGVRPGAIEPAYRANERCFFRKDHVCGKVFAASKSCFVACPSDRRTKRIVDTIVDKLMKAGVDPVVAVRERKYGEDIVCTKICGKIIESQFCIAILDDVTVSGARIPNPNVYYEYGLMTALGKHIVPLQREGQDLAFNIQSYDTIKYSTRTIRAELDIAIADALLPHDDTSTGNESAVVERRLLRALEMAGFRPASEGAALGSVTRETPFRVFVADESHTSVVMAKIDDESEVQLHLDDLPVVLVRIKRQVQSLESRLAKANDDLNDALVEHEEQKKFIKYATKPYGLNRAEEAVESFAESLGYARQVALAFIVTPSIDRGGMRDAVSLITEGTSLSGEVWDHDGQLVVGQHVVELPPLGGEAPNEGPS